MLTPLEHRVCWGSAAGGTTKPAAIARPARASKRFWYML